MCVSINSSFIFLLLVITISVGIIRYYDAKNEKLIFDIALWSKENEIDLKKEKIVLKSFKIEYDENEWKFLLQKLNLTRYPTKLDEKYVKKFEYGFDTEYLKELVEYWKTEFNWEKRIAYLNKYKQFKFIINDEINIHFIRLQTNMNKSENNIKMMLIDGWPGSFSNFYKLLDYLNNNFKDFSLDIIIPSIPGYGYSTPLNKPVDNIDTAIYFDALMRYLHGENVVYYLHGEDWGSFIATLMAQLFPLRINGIHITMPFSSELIDLTFLFNSLASKLVPSMLFTPKEIEMNLTKRYTFRNALSVVWNKTAYFHYQATWPDTIGQPLSDSPAGLASYILEKYSLWSFDFNEEIVGKKDGGLNNFNKDDLLTTVTIYWITNSITSSMRYYKTSVKGTFDSKWPISNILLAKVSQIVPVAVQYFKNEPLIYPSKVVKLKYQNLQRYNINENGGHFGAFENPKITADDLMDFIKQTSLSSALK